MNTQLRELRTWMDADEDEHLEFKEAKVNFHFDKLVKYCAALANEGGGRFILGVTDKRPRRVVGSRAFTDLQRTKTGLIQRLRLRIEAEEIPHPDGRVVVVTVPSRPLGMPVAVKGAYWMRSGEELAPMTPDMLKRIFDEAEPDFSAEVCREATLEDLDPAAIEQFRMRWVKKSKNESLIQLPVEQLLADAELIVPTGVTYAALILLGKHRGLGQLLAQAEVVFEYRSTQSAGPANQREEFRQGFSALPENLWVNWERSVGLKVRFSEGWEGKKNGWLEEGAPPSRDDGAGGYSSRPRPAIPCGVAPQQGPTPFHRVLGSIGKMKLK